jgi:rod shape determining protein RodA
VTEPDIGSAFVWAPVTAAVLLVGSIPYRYLISIFLIGMAIIPIGFHFGLKDYQKARITTFIKLLQDQKIDVRGDGWVPHHIRLAIGSAGWEGKGYLASRTEDKRTVLRMGFIPKDVAINDFIFAVIAEEHGFRGSMLLLFAQALLLLLCLVVAFFARDATGRLIVTGVVALIFSHIFMNVGMDINLTPITGLPLPLISYGGTFMVIILFLLGMVQSVWVHRHMGLEEPDKKP